jgi:hypothetical protein
MRSWRSGQGILGLAMAVGRLETLALIALFLPGRGAADLQAYPT